VSIVVQTKNDRGSKECGVYERNLHFLNADLSREKLRPLWEESILKVFWRYHSFLTYYGFKNFEVFVFN
jgi:hypothetical protein